MSFIRKHSGDSTRPIVATYTCPLHEGFDWEVERDENGEAPDKIHCPFSNGNCPCDATWTPSPIACRVRRVEAIKGRWERPERPTYLDTRELGEGMDIEEFQAKRAAIWERKRQEDVMAVKKGFG